MENIQNIGLLELSIDESQEIDGGFDPVEFFVGYLIVEIIDGVYNGLKRPCK